MTTVRVLMQTKNIVPALILQCEASTDYRIDYSIVKCITNDE